eukprot:2209359-Amphidinium_carterae.1
MSSSTINGTIMPIKTLAQTWCGSVTTLVRIALSASRKESATLMSKRRMKQACCTRFYHGRSCSSHIMCWHMDHNYMRKEFRPGTPETPTV